MIVKQGTRNEKVTERCTTKVISNAEKFYSNIENMQNPHIRDCVGLEEKNGVVEDYSEFQEQKDLENYKFFMNSQASDILTTEKVRTKSLTLRQISSYH